MNNRIWLYDYHLFEGEGGGEGATASTSAPSESAKERVEYGKAKGNDGANSQVGTDNGGQAQDLDAEWKALTGKGGRYHDLYGADVSKAIQDRFKNQADLQGQVDQITEDLSPLFMN